MVSTDKSILRRTDSVLRSNDMHSQAYKWLTNYNTLKMGTVIVSGRGEGMKQGLNGAGDGLVLIK